MSKELEESLGLVKRTCEIYADSLKQRNLIGSDIIENQINEALDTIKQALKRLEAIDNSNPSKALKGLKHIKKYYVPEPCTATTYNYLEIIEQSLLKTQEQEKVLEIVFEKRIDLESFYATFIENDYDYNYYEEMYGTYGKYKLTEEEFNLLKRYFENGRNKTN